MNGISVGTKVYLKDTDFVDHVGVIFSITGRHVTLDMNDGAQPPPLFPWHRIRMIGVAP